jgi:hypothetical protein
MAEGNEAYAAQYELSPGQEVTDAEEELDAAYESGDPGRIFWAETEVVAAYERAGLAEPSEPEAEA